MADNLTLNTGTGGDTLAADDIGGVKYPRTKLTIGADGVDDGDVAAGNPLPVTATTLTTIAGAVRDEDSASSSGQSGVVVLGVRQDVDGPLTGTDGDYTWLKCDEVGRLKVATQPGSVVATTGNITGNGQTVQCDVSRFSNVMMHCTGTFGTVNCTFEGSIDSGTSWFAIQAIRTNANTIELVTGNLSAAPAYAWEASVNGMTHVRVRSTAWASGTQVWRFQPAPYATEPIPGAQVSATQPVSGTVTATVTGGTINGVTPTASNINSGASTNTAFIKASAGTVFSIAVWNSGGSPAYVKFYNQTTAPTLASAVPIFVIACAATSSELFSFGPHGNRFGTGIAIAITGGAADTDTTATTAAQVKVSTAYI